MQNVLSNVLANMDDGGEFIQPQLWNEFKYNGGEEHIMKQNIKFSPEKQIADYGTTVHEGPEEQSPPQQLQSRGFIHK